MVRKLAYDGGVKRRNQATLAVFSAIIGILAMVPGAAAQINAAPPSVTSLGFGGRAINGAPPSVTSLGPLGYTPGFNPAFPNSRPTFGVNPFLPQTNHHHHRPDGFIPWGGTYYAIPYGYYDSGDQATDDPSTDQYNGGPTIFDRRGSGKPAPPPSDYAERVPPQSPSAVPAAESEAAPATDQPPTVLVFKDGHQLEVENYAIVGNTLYDLTEGHRHKIPLSELDLDATTKQNGDRGIDFQVPAGS